MGYVLWRALVIIGVWIPLLRSWANSSTIHVLLGSVLDANSDGRRDNDEDFTWWVNNRIRGVAILTHFYAVVVRCINDKSLEPADCKSEQLDAVGMLFQHPTEPGISKLPYSRIFLRDSISLPFCGFNFRGCARSCSCTELFRKFNFTVNENHKSGPLET